MMYPYMTLSDETEIVHSQLIEDKGIKKVIVNFERPTDNGFDSARCELPEYKWTEKEGYSDEEIAFFEKLLHQYDRPVSFFYLDPPYHATEGYYQNIGEDGFTEADHIRLWDALMRIEGKFLLSYNDDAFVRGLYDRPGIYLMETTRINNIKQRYDNGAQFPELLIANYDLRERSRAVPSQMTLFDWNGGEAIG